MYCELAMVKWNPFSFKRIDKWVFILLTYPRRAAQFDRPEFQKTSRRNHCIQAHLAKTSFPLLISTILGAFLWSDLDQDHWTSHYASKDRQIHAGPAPLLLTYCSPGPHAEGLLTFEIGVNLGEAEWNLAAVVLSFFCSRLRMEKL